MLPASFISFRVPMEFFPPYDAILIVTPFRISSSNEYFPARMTMNWTGFSTRVSRMLESPSVTRRTVFPGAKGTKGFFTFTVQWTV